VATDADRDRIAAYRDRFRAAVREIGVPSVDRLVIRADQVLRLVVEEIYEQTPGPGAGARVAGTR
jgi:hypothetical protein